MKPTESQIRAAYRGVDVLDPLEMFEIAHKLMEPEIAKVRNAALEEAAKAVADHNKAGREWVPGSLWDTLTKEAAQRVRALKQPNGDNQ